MRALVSLAIVVLIAVGGYFALLAAGVIGGPSPLSAEEINTNLTAFGDEINADGGLRYDDWSVLATATVVEKQITIRGNSLLNMADLDEGYLASREAQALSKLCGDPASRAVLTSGATYVFNWFSADDESIGMVTLRGAEDSCA